MSIEKHKAFLDSLDGEKKLPAGMHRWLYTTPIEELDRPKNARECNEFIEYLQSRVELAESATIEARETAKSFRSNAALYAVEAKNDGSVNPDDYLDEIEKNKFSWE